MLAARRSTQRRGRRMALKRTCRPSPYLFRTSAVASGIAALESPSIRTRPAMPLLLAQHLIRPRHQRHQVRRGHEPGVLIGEVGVADPTGP
jgi:hypothetical protein